MLHHKPRRKRGAALLLSALMLFASVHFTPPAAAGNEWVMDSVNKLTSWGVITGRDTGDQQLNAVITRAERLYRGRGNPVHRRAVLSLVRRRYRNRL